VQQPLHGRIALDDHGAVGELGIGIHCAGLESAPARPLCAFGACLVPWHRVT
jgi:hypothetical protein